MSAFAGLVNLVKLDLERCPKIHGGLVHLEGLFISKQALHWVVNLYFYPMWTWQNLYVGCNLLKMLTFYTFKDFKYARFFL